MRKLNAIHSDRETALGAIAIINAELKAAKEFLNALDLEMLEAFDNLGMDSMIIGERRYSAVEAPVVEHVEWDEFYEWIMAHQAIGLLQKRIKLKDLLDLMDAGESPDGITMTVLTKLKALKV